MTPPLVNISDPFKRKRLSTRLPSGTLQLQLANTSAYYTYLLLLLKSLVYFVVAAVCLLGRTADCGNAKSS